MVNMRSAFYILSSYRRRAFSTATLISTKQLCNTFYSPQQCHTLKCTIRLYTEGLTNALQKKSNDPLGVCLRNNDIEAAYALFESHLQTIISDTNGLQQTSSTSHKQALPSKNLTPLVSIITELMRHGHTEVAWKCYNTLASQNIPLGLEVYHAFYQILSDTGQMHDAERLFSEMLHSYISPNTKTYAILIRGFSNLGDDQGVLKIHNMIKVDLNIDIDIDLYNAIMDAYNRLGAGLEVLSIFDLLIANNYPINNTTVSIVLDSCGSIYQMHRTTQIWNSLKQNGFKLNEENATSYIEALARHSIFEEAKRVLMEEMKELGLKPSQKTLRALLTYLHAWEKREDEFEVIDWVRREHPELASELRWIQDIKSIKELG